MSDPSTAHYDTFQNTGRSVLVLDSIRAVCEAINNDALASSKEQPVMAGIENNCTALGTGAQMYTTVPLRPLTGDCNFLLNNYIHHRIPFRIPMKCQKIVGYNSDGTPNLSTAVDAAPASDIDYAIYFLSSALIPKRFQLMIGNTVIYQNTFQRTEATVTINSLPPDVVEKSDDITTMSKLLNRKTIPGQYFTWKAAEQTQSLNFTIDTTIDLQRFAPIISNLAFIPVEYGDLKLRLFYDDLFNALDISVLPSNRNGDGVTFSGTNDANVATETISHNNLNIIERKPLLTGVVFKEPQIAVMTNGTPSGTGACTVSFAGGHTLRFSVVGSESKAQGDTYYSWGDNNQTLVEIVQSTFRLREESKILLKNYIMQDNRLIIPTHTWSTALALNGPSKVGGQMMWNFSAYNIDMLAFTFPINSNYESYLPNPLFTDFDVKLNSKSVNYLPYQDPSAYMSRFVKDTKQAFLNTDEYATNENLTYSLKPFSTIYNGTINGSQLANHVYEAYKCNSNNIEFKPNTFCYAINLTPPNSFEKGMCVASSNPQAAQLRITYNTATFQPPGQADAGKYNHLWSDVYDYREHSNTPPMALALQGCCLVLIYNPIVGACQAGEVVFVEPFLN